MIEPTDADWERINAAGAASAARQAEARNRPPEKLLRSLEHARDGQYRRIFREGRFIGYERVIEQPIGEMTSTGFRNGTVA